MKTLKIAFACLLVTATVWAQNDTIYFMKNGLVINKQSIKTNDVDSCVFYNPNLFTDTRDGNVYKTVRIGNQTWLAENLRYLPTVSPVNSGSYSSPYYYVYNYNGTDVTAAKATNNYRDYGVLYNWNAARIACPPGWHLPTDQEWSILETSLGGGSVAGGKLKEAGLLFWNTPNLGATNEVFFNIRPGGVRSVANYFAGVKDNGSFWTNSEESSGNSYVRVFAFDNSSCSKVYYGKGHGISVRCVKD